MLSALLRTVASVFLVLSSLPPSLLLPPSSFFLLPTADAADAWSAQTPPVTTRLAAVTAVSPQLAWAAGSSGKVLNTNDGGRTWVEQSITATPAVADALNAITAANATTPAAVAPS